MPGRFEYLMEDIICQRNVFFCKTCNCQPQTETQNSKATMTNKQTSVDQIVKSTVHLGFMGTVAFLPQSMPPAPARPPCFSATLSEDVFAPLASTVGLRLKTR